MASRNDPNALQFALLESNGDGTWTAIEINHPDEKDLYIAVPWSHLEVPDPFDGYEEEADEEPTTRPEAASWARINNLVLNKWKVSQPYFLHKNIVSMAGDISDESCAATLANAGLQPAHFSVWDYCASSDLSVRLQDLRESHDEPMKESFCWHVLTSLLEAITYLHEGKYLVEEEGQRRWRASIDTWTPILHGRIKPQYVCFQQKRQGEQHDRCKLADLRRAVALNHEIYNDIEAVELDEDGGSADTRLERLTATLSSEECPWKPQNPHKHSLDTELYALGHLIATMMTGKTDVTRLTDEDKSLYSEQLAVVVQFLLDQKDRKRHAEIRVERVLPLTKVVMEYFREWKTLG